MKRALIVVFAVAIFGVAAIVPASASGIVPTKHALIYGDSLTWESSWRSGAVFGTHAAWTVADEALPGTAPCDWLPQLASDLATYRPTIVGVETVGNANRSCMAGPDGMIPAMDSPAFLARYQADLATFMATVTATGARLVFIDGPPVNDPYVPVWTQTVTDVNTIGRTLAGNYHGVSVAIGPRNAVSNSGKYTTYKTCLSTETATMGCAAGQIPVRTLSGIQEGLHFCPDGLPFTGCDMYASGEERFGGAEAQALISPPKPVLP